MSNDTTSADAGATLQQTVASPTAAGLERTSTLISTTSHKEMEDLRFPTETTVGDLSFPYADGRSVRDTSSSLGQSTWSNVHGNETVLSLAQKELQKMRARARAEEHEDH